MFGGTFLVLGSVTSVGWARRPSPSSLDASRLLLVGGVAVQQVGMILSFAAQHPVPPPDLDRFKVGETTMADAMLCLGKPTSTTKTGDEEQWRYEIQRPARYARVVDLTFKGGVLSEIHKSASNVSSR